MRSVGNVYNPTPEMMPATSSKDEKRHLESRAIETACDIRYHRSFTAGAVRVSYSDTGDPAGHTLLFAGGMFGGRYQAYPWDELAKSHRVRIIAIDRPGIGGTTEVPLEKRIMTWLDIVPALLNHLNIKQVSLACHSAGTMYVLATVINLKHLLHPEAVIAFFGPWVPPRHSGRWTMGAVSAMPTSAITGWAGFARFAHNYLGPTFGALQASAAVFRKGPTDDDKLSSTIQHIITKYVFAENISGANDEALMCLERGDTGWVGLEEAFERIPKGVLRIQVFYAENDEMIGEGGERYLDDCLKHAVGRGITVDRFKVKDTDHNSVLWPDYGAARILMATLGGVVDAQAEGCHRKP